MLMDDDDDARSYSFSSSPFEHDMCELSCPIDVSIFSVQYDAYL